MIDLTNPEVQRELGTSVQELTGDWSYAQSTMGLADTQRLGEAGHASGAILGFMYPSAKNTGKGAAIVVFADRLAAHLPSFVEIFDPHHHLSQRLLEGGFSKSRFHFDVVTAAEVDTTSRRYCDNQQGQERDREASDALFMILTW